MTETSVPWGGTILGDAGPYSDDVWSDIWRKWFTRDRTDQGVLRINLNELIVTGVASPVAVASGSAIVDGKFYESDASVNVVIPTPAGATRIDRIVLQKDFVAQTVRIARVAGAEGGGAPALTQIDGTTWEISLAQASITIGGVITITDERTFLDSTVSIRERVAVLEVFGFRNNETVVTGDDAGRLPIPPAIDGRRLSFIRAKVKTAPSGGTVTIQIFNIDGAVDILSTLLTIDDGETSSETAAVPVVINVANDDVSDGDDLRVDIDAANGAVGLQVEFGFLPV